ncbi:outer membrane beta-barrel family protein [Mucilaginibacter frigoritolerans]|uniref:outer membrane beta-barrel family protein n=1 Tax=Mucilaginibacter frigoritolerans TaxID=652788 RepID=UPI001476E2C4|nr:outer membrane beta-barrel family protein [Mucilaginibacter frigoritolerans]
MKISIIFFLIFLLIIKVHYSYAQEYSISGKVLDNANKPVSFINVVLRNDSLKGGKTITDTAGIFTLKVTKGNYTLLFEQFGHPLLTKQITIESDQNLGNIIIDEVVMLKSVDITARKNLIERKVDRLVVNVENLPSSQGTDAIGVLQNTPLVNADENSGISIVGKGAVSIMVNDRMIYLSGIELINYLKSIKSENIAKVEVITTPPAKYDAQGNGGIINILLKKNPYLGWNGSYTASFSQATKSGFGNNFNLNYQSSKISSTLILKQSDNPVTVSGYNDIIGTTSVLTNYNSSNKSSLYGATYTLDYKIDNKTTIGLYADYNKTSTDRSMLYNLKYLTNSSLDSTLNTRSLQNGTSDIFQSNLYASRKIGENGKKVEFNANLLTTNPYNTVNFITGNLSDGNINQVLTQNQLNYRIYSGQVDFTLPYNWILIETGGKFTRFINKSSQDYYNIINGESSFDYNNSDDFSYRENNIAGYISASKKLSKLWTIKAGLRYEYTFINDYSQTLAQPNSDQYGKLFPTFYLTFTPNQNNTFYLNYSERINRPNFSLLNPFRNYSNPYIYYAGNPELQPSYTHNLEFGYTRSKINLTVYGSVWTNGNAYITQLENGVQINTQANYITQKSVGTSLFYNDFFFNVWGFTPSMNLSYMTSQTSISNTVAKNGVSAYANIFNSVNINKSKTVTALLSYNEFFGNYSGNIRNYSRGNLSTGLKISLLDRTLQMNLAINDLLKQQYSHGEAFYTTFYQEYKNYADARKLTLSVTYSFGNKKVKTNNRNVKFDDKGRAN